MNRTMRRAATTATATVGAMALMVGTAAAHYCYFDAPAGSKADNGQAWQTQEEMAAMLTSWTSTWTGECRAAADAVIAEVEALPDGTLFMGPGLLAGGAVAKGKAPKRIGHLDVHSVPRHCFGP